MSDLNQDLEACGWFVRTKRTADGGGFLIADFSATSDGARYAQLFAAAPDMAEALKLVLSIVRLRSGEMAVIEAALLKAGIQLEEREA